MGIPNIAERLEAKTPAVSWVRKAQKLLSRPFLFGKVVADDLPRPGAEVQANLQATVVERHPFAGVRHTRSDQLFFSFRNSHFCQLFRLKPFKVGWSHQSFRHVGLWHFPTGPMLQVLQSGAGRFGRMGPADLARGDKCKGTQGFEITELRIMIKVCLTLYLYCITCLFED